MLVVITTALDALATATTQATTTQATTTSTTTTAMAMAEAKAMPTPRPHIQTCSSFLCSLCVRVFVCVGWAGAWH